MTSSSCAALVDSRLRGNDGASRHRLRKWRVGAFLALILYLCMVPKAYSQYIRESLSLVSEASLPANLVQNSSEVTTTPNGHWEILFRISDWPNFTLTAPESGWDWSAYVGLGFRLRNPSDEKIAVSMRIDNPGADGSNFCNTARDLVAPNAAHDFEAIFNTGEPKALWGMRGVPREPQHAGGDILDTSNVVAFQLFLSKPEAPRTLVIEDIYLLRRRHDTSTPVPLPFVNRFGQFIHDAWPGKLGSEDELRQRRDAERQELAAQSAPEAFDVYGGWADGPQLDSTGWFRTERTDGRWWLVTPKGALFFSTGIDCVGTWQRTFIEEREAWFEWLPKESDPRFGKFYGHRSGAHSMAEVIGGEGKVFGFYPVNLIRKYGGSWEDQWRESAYARLKAWGFNSIGNWSQQDVLLNSPVPFTVSATIDNVRPIEGATGYWAKMKDVYAPEFTEEVDRAVQRVAKLHSGNPLCIGYFVDNELAWEGVKRGALDSPADQPARVALLVFLEDRYKSIEVLNRAWKTDYADWSQITRDKGDRRKIDDDLDDYLHAFALRYFETVAAAIKRHAQNQLYLGCRFSTAPEPAVRACAEVADVVSFNRYTRTLNCDSFKLDDAPDKPVIIGEFHFGALDRGMFHTGLVPVEGQEERAVAYAEYVQSGLECPQVVGTHWFQYVDEPLTGRYYDGENYNIGFVDVTDTPYPELVRAATALHATMYSLRSAPDRKEAAR